MVEMKKPMSSKETTGGMTSQQVTDWIKNAFLGQGFKDRIAKNDALPNIYKKGEGCNYNPNWPDHVLDTEVAYVQPPKNTQK